MSLSQISTIPDSVRMEKSATALGSISVVTSIYVIAFNAVAVCAISNGSVIWSNYMMWPIVAGIAAFVSAPCVAASAGSFCYVASDDEMVLPPRRLCTLSAYGCTTVITNMLSLIADTIMVVLIAIYGEASWGWAMSALVIGVPAVPCAYKITRIVQARTAFVRARR